MEWSNSCKIHRYFFIIIIRKYWFFFSFQKFSFLFHFHFRTHQNPPNRMCRRTFFSKYFQNCSQLPLLRVWVDGAEVKSPQGSPPSTGVRVGAPAPLPGVPVLGSKPPRRSNPWLEGVDTGLIITESAAGRGAGLGAPPAPGGGGRRRGPAPGWPPPRGFSFFVGRSRFRLTLKRKQI